VTSSLAVFEDAIRVKSTHLIKLYFKNLKKTLYGNKIYFDKSPSERTVRHRIHSQGQCTHVAHMFVYHWFTFISESWSAWSACWLERH